MKTSPGYRTHCPSGCLPEAGETPTVPLALRAFRLASVFSVLLLAVPLAVLLPLLSPRRRVRELRRLAGLLLRALGVRVVHTGPRGGAALLVANHLSWLDAAALLVQQPIHVVADARTARGFLGRLVAGGGTIFLDRSRLRALPDTIAEITSALRAGLPVGAFPEGVRRCSSPGGPFAPAVFEAALRAGVPVRPTLIEHRLRGGRATSAAAFLGGQTLPENVRAIAAIRGLEVHVRALPVLDPSRHRSRAALCRAAKAAIDRCSTPDPAACPAANPKPFIAEKRLITPRDVSVPCS
ncbi:lysophospholipid acyltransferase family protein [Allokutzneria albata]|uniref:1-acyl-sn-glycerol-3-phosphate acyltransferases n=1 Tax=Allokutzneria albata TaxID=211114 RepID=A0A1G9WX20_ALLAB|nr:lysophospholipid acyltransferase family protein [Allokutzneria albata]SDM88683.1 1-acyl-sn-glycerol-3-phosphate acyltransferases [Allokutzneria albata]